MSMSMSRSMNRATERDDVISWRAWESIGFIGSSNEVLVCLFRGFFFLLNFPLRLPPRPQMPMRAQPR